jgi:hypothetical protein
MSHPVMSHPKDFDDFAGTSLIAQGFHPNPALLEACIEGPAGKIKGVPCELSGAAWAFSFEIPKGPKWAGTYKVSVMEPPQEKGQPEHCCIPVRVSLTYREVGRRGSPTIMSPSPNTPQNPMPQTFVAWGPLSQGANLAADDYQTMTGSSGAVTYGVHLQAPPGYFMVQFSVADNPLQNPYTLIITDDSRGASTPDQPIYLTTNPPAPPAPPTS